MKDETKFKLLIAGPDEGELEKIEIHLGNTIEYVGALYGEEKIKLWEIAHYYVLPSFSEGFPTSVVEAMSFGAIPIISKGCNFPQVFELGLGYEVSPDGKTLENVLRILLNKPFDNALSLKNIEYIKNYLTVEIIGEKLFAFYRRIIEMPTH